jgi:hypothetical protein
MERPVKCLSTSKYIYIVFNNSEISHHHKHQGLDPLIRSVSRVTAALANVS